MLYLLYSQCSGVWSQKPCFVWAAHCVVISFLLLSEAIHSWLKYFHNCSWWVCVCVCVAFPRSFDSSTIPVFGCLWSSGVCSVTCLALPLFSKGMHVVDEIKVLEGFLTVHAVFLLCNRCPKQKGKRNRCQVGVLTYKCVWIVLTVWQMCLNCIGCLQENCHESLLI